MEKERCRWEIISDVLNVLKEEGNLKETPIMHRVNLEWRNFNRYFDFLLEEGFIANCNHDPECYELTENGENFLENIEELIEVIEMQPTFSFN
jgi:predicted transcriptional regulator